jgi:hypothetical protein
VIGQLCKSIVDATAIVLDRDGPGALGQWQPMAPVSSEKVNQFHDKVDDVVDGTVVQDIVTEVDVECEGQRWVTRIRSVFDLG